LLHPVADAHASVVHALPSSHDCVAPPAVHCPVTHVFWVVNVRPVHDDDAHCVASATFVHAKVPCADVHAWHTFAGFACPSAKHVAPIRQRCACSVFPHPATGSHESVVQVLPSSHDRTAPPAVHCPETQVLDAVHDKPVHVPAAHCAPSSRVVHAVVLLAVTHAWHPLPGFACPSP
jgi:hypothetical protein